MSIRLALRTVILIRETRSCEAGNQIAAGIPSGRAYVPGRSAEITMASCDDSLGDDEVDVGGSIEPRSAGMIGGDIYAGSWWPARLLRLYETLTLSDAVTPVDLIYVMAGKMERKDYGLELYRAGLSPRLVLGVGRFEVSKMHRVALEHALVKELVALRDKTPADQRHFLVKLYPAGASIEQRTLRRWSTYGEILDLKNWLQAKTARTVIVVSTDVHLRRVALTCTAVFRGAPIEFLYCPVPAGFSLLKKEGWWTRPGDRRFVIVEMMKLAGYRVILSLPAWASRRLMRLKN